MALSNYYELSAMLRMQLPILLSFAVLRCFMGAVVKFWLRRLVPQRVQTLAKPVSDATLHLLSIMYGALLITAFLYAAFYYFEWDDKRYPHNSDESRLMAGKPIPPLMCTEFAHTRVNGLMSAVGLLALFTSGDPMTLGLSLSTLKAVADGSVASLPLGFITWNSARSVHETAPYLFFIGLLSTSAIYSTVCYTDDKIQNRTGGAAIASSFATFVLTWRASASGLHKTWQAWVRLRTRCIGAIRGAALSVYIRLKPPSPVPALPAPESEPTHPHKD